MTDHWRETWSRLSDDRANTEVSPFVLLLSRCAVPEMKVLHTHALSSSGLSSELRIIQCLAASDTDQVQSTLILAGSETTLTPLCAPAVEGLVFVDDHRFHEFGLRCVHVNRGTIAGEERRPASLFLESNPQNHNNLVLLGIHVIVWSRRRARPTYQCAHEIA